MIERIKLSLVFIIIVTWMGSALCMFAAGAMHREEDATFVFICGCITFGFPIIIWLLWLVFGGKVFDWFGD